MAHLWVWKSTVHSDLLHMQDLITILIFELRNLFHNQRFHGINAATHQVRTRLNVNYQTRIVGGHTAAVIPVNLTKGQGISE